LLAFVSAAAAFAAEPPASPSDQAPGKSAVLRPAVGERNSLPAALTRPSPVSLDDLKAIERHVTNLVARVSPAVVALEIGSAIGSGVVISPDGLVLTAGHVCGRPDRWVTFIFPDGKRVRGKTLGVDEDTDTGLAKIEDRGPWPCAPPGDLTNARPGDWTLALGHPGGFDRRRSLVVRLGRIIRLSPGILQTDCTISPGDSGGPLFDMFGHVIGIHNAISGSMAANFHAPITDYYQAWNRLAPPTVDATPSPQNSAAARGDAASR
jgi:serine protease Do